MRKGKPDIQKKQSRCSRKPAAEGGVAFACALFHDGGALSDGEAARLCHLAARRLAKDSGAGELFSKSLDFTREKNGKPVLEKGFLSLTHTRAFAAAAIATCPVGIDAERIRTVPHCLALRILTEAELAGFNALAEEEKNLYLIKKWTEKESLLKLTGEGLAGGMKTISEAGESTLVRNGEGFFLRRFSLKTELLLAVCTAEPCAVELRVFGSADELFDFAK